MKGTIFHFSTWHDGILKQWIRCGVHHSAIAFQFHSFRILEEKLWWHDSIPLVVVKSPNQKSVFIAYSKWMDLKALHDVFRFQHCIGMTNVNWTQQVWIRNQFINAEARKLFPLPLSWSCSKYVVLVVNMVLLNHYVINCGWILLKLNVFVLFESIVLWKSMLLDQSWNLDNSTPIGKL